MTSEARFCLCAASMALAATRLAGIRQSRNRPGLRRFRRMSRGQSGIFPRLRRHAAERLDAEICSFTLCPPACSARSPSCSRSPDRCLFIHDDDPPAGGAGSPRPGVCCGWRSGCDAGPVERLQRRGVPAIERAAKMIPQWLSKQDAPPLQLAREFQLRVQRSMTQIWCGIPVYNNAATIADVARRCREQIASVVVVDDGSTDADLRDLLKSLDVAVVRHPSNQGKGAALLTALKFASERGAEYLLTIDGDGQHFPEDIPALPVRGCRRTPFCSAARETSSATCRDPAGSDAIFPISGSASNPASASAIPKAAFASIP